MIARSVIGTAWGMAAYKANIITTHDMLLDAVFRHLTLAQPIPKVFCRHATVVHPAEIREKKIRDQREKKTR